MVLAEKESLLVSVIYSEIENRIIVKVGVASHVKGLTRVSWSKSSLKRWAGAGEVNNTSLKVVGEVRSSSRQQSQPSGKRWSRRFADLAAQLFLLITFILIAT